LYHIFIHRKYNDSGQKGVKYILNYNAILIFFLALSTWLQMWAISTQGFGISISTIILIVIGVLNLTKLRFNKKQLIYAIVIIIWMIISSWLLNDLSNAWILRVMRYSMVIFIAIICNSLFSNIKYLQCFHKNLATITVIGCVYGYYQIVAPNYHLPYFLNVFSNNSSYSPKDLYFYYGGWVEAYRVYGVFAEPAFYASFLALFLVAVLFCRRSDYLNKPVVLFLICTNLFFSYSRIGYAVAGSIILLYLLFTKLNWGRIGKPVCYAITVLVICIPLLMPIIMGYLFDSETFIDKSSSGRTISQQYYLDKGLEPSNLLGYGVGSISQQMQDKAQHGDVEAQAHNGMITMIYEMGTLSILLYLFLMFELLKSAKNLAYIAVFLGGIATLLSMGDFYSIESIMILICYLYNLPRYLVSDDQEPTVVTR
jgi:hypothetical protein